MRSADPDVGNGSRPASAASAITRTTASSTRRSSTTTSTPATFNHHHAYQVWKTKANGGGPASGQGPERGAYRAELSQTAMALCPFNGALYVGSSIQSGGDHRYNLVGPVSGEIVRIFPDQSPELLSARHARRRPAGSIRCRASARASQHLRRLHLAHGRRRRLARRRRCSMEPRSGLAHRASPTAQEPLRISASTAWSRSAAASNPSYQVRRELDPGVAYRHGQPGQLRPPDARLRAGRPFIGTANLFGLEALAKLASRDVYIPNPYGGTEVCSPTPIPVHRGYPRARRKLRHVRPADAVDHLARGNQLIAVTGGVGSSAATSSAACSARSIW